MEKEKVPISEKYTLTLEEASRYFGVGETKLRRIVNEDRSAGFLLMNGSKILIKRKKFEEMIDKISSI